VVTFTRTTGVASRALDVASDGPVFGLCRVRDDRERVKHHGLRVLAATRERQ